MNTKRVAMLVLLGSMVVAPVAQAQIKHIEMRVEGMT
jgi:mannitol-specific phosphotransferase system IIBC component